MARSIMQSVKRCYLCNRISMLEEHHIFGGANRKLSEKYGIKVYLCHNCHNEAPLGVHFNREKMLKLKQYGQRAFMEHYEKNIDEFRAIFGKNYI